MRFSPISSVRRHNGHRCLTLLFVGWLVMTPAAALAAGQAAETTPASSADSVVKLPPPNLTDDRPLMRALRLRRTDREVRAAPLPPGLLGGLLWAGFGINRPASGGRTVPSAMNAQEIDLYVATAKGVFLYEPTAHALRRLQSTDLREMTGGGAFAAVAPVTLIYVADGTRQQRARPEDRRFYAAITTGGIVQNVYLFAASEGLATVVHELNRPPLTKALKLRPDQHIILAQAIGFPK